MIGLVLLLMLVAIILASVVMLDNLVSTKEQARIEEEVNRTHLQTMQAAQRIYALTWRARQAMFDEAKRNQSR